MQIITVELSTPFKYSLKNQGEVECNFLEIPEPTGKQAHLLGVLRSQLGTATKKAYEGVDLSAVADTSDNGPDTSDNGPDSPEDIGEALFTVLTMGGADMSVVMVTFKEILRDSALAGGEKALTTPMFDRMTYADVEKTLKSYLGNFLAASE